MCNSLISDCFELLDSWIHCFLRGRMVLISFGGILNFTPSTFIKVWRDCKKWFFSDALWLVKKYIFMMFSSWKGFLDISHCNCFHFVKRVNINNIYFGFDLLNLDLLTKKRFFYLSCADSQMYCFIWGNCRISAD